MNHYTVITDLFEINRRLFHDLWHITPVTGCPDGLSPRLILPKKRDADVRISEQEARFLYCSSLNLLNYFYSVETPTDQTYVQTGKKPQSASSDLSLYTFESEFKKCANVEFKAHNVSYEQIRKDIEKLVREGRPKKNKDIEKPDRESRPKNWVHGNWVHVLKNVDSKTLVGLFEKFRKSLSAVLSKERNLSVSILFSFCIIEKRWGCIKYFDLKALEAAPDNYIDDFFKLSYSVKKGQVVEDNSNGWEIIKQKV
ncbi:MAG: hypothetical protein KJ550_05850 [Proteobacteria bacterium]|nr:hypothetical protein [Pseudomonadota bacterium]MBU4067138.1 hypothetical protein [Pseudomonadota bacterium]MBU4126710.1 hypothetical protein [Pseudomonadota bacterium]